MGIQIAPIDTPTAPESVLRELSDYYLLVEEEDMPGDPPTPFEMRIADWRHLLPHMPVKRWLLREDGEIRGSAVAVYDLEQNLENGFGRIHVHPQHRRRGLARMLATPMFDELESAGRTRFDTWVKNDDPAEDLSSRLGLKAVYQDKRSRLLISNLDMDLMQTWIDRSSERADGYELRYFRAPLPDEVVQDYCDLAFIMNTAPREDYEADDEVMTPKALRDIEASVIESKCEMHYLIAVKTASGDFAGYTQVKTQELQPDLAWQWDTGVHPGHRNLGLGRWLKAAMVKRIVADHPEVVRIDTFNAGSNEPMLNINVAMGFKPIHMSRAWQGDLVTARERLRA